MERLQKYLARCGVASRRAAEELMRDGKVTVNGAVVTEMGSQVEPETDEVRVEGRPVSLPTAMVYLAVNKPVGVVTSASDPWGRPTVAELVPRLGRLFPVGRLDVDSEGLVLMTNDGELANRLMHPRYGCEKEYWALVPGAPSEDALSALRRGVELDDGTTLPALVDLDRDSRGGHCWVRVILREGRNRQVRRMLAAVGSPVERLRRVRIGPLELENLPLGGSRPLARSEVAALRVTAGMEG